MFRPEILMTNENCPGRFILFVAALLLSSCDGNRMADLRGTVSLNGQPVDEGSILFRSQDDPQGPEWGGPIKNGKYEAKLPPGTMKVTVSWLKSTGQKKKTYDTPDSPEVPELEEVIPAKYNSATELRFEVKPGRNQKDWDLTK